MELLNSITLQGGGEEKRIELYQGDLTKLSPDEAVDILVVSAYPKDYTPTPSSLIGALHWKGVMVDELADDKEIDIRKSFSCWLSKEIKSTDPGIQFKRILCFEPLVRGKPPEVVGDIFRSLAPILGDFEQSSTVAMPLVAAGDQDYAGSEILPPLLDAAIHWMTHGLPLKVLKIVTYSDEKANECKLIFEELKLDKKYPSFKTTKEFKYDVFISYARENTSSMKFLQAELEKQYPSIKMFLDRKDIKVGAAWQPEIFESLDECKRLIALFSPDYLQSRVCKEEFNIAWIRSREIDDNIIFPIYLFSADLPTYMKYGNYIDCREGDADKLSIASSQLVSELT